MSNRSKKGNPNLNGEEAERADRLRQIQRERERVDGPYADVRRGEELNHSTEKKKNRRRTEDGKNYGDLGDCVCVSAWLRDWGRRRVTAFAWVEFQKLEFRF
jgi:hypothetical protein